MDDKRFIELAQELRELKRMMENLKIRESGATNSWTPIIVSAAYVSATSFTLAGDFTAYFKIGVKVRLTNTTVKYGYILSSSYSAPNTTVNLVANDSYSLANAAITNVSISYASPPDFPPYLSWTPTITPSSGAFTTVSGTLHFYMTGPMLFWNMSIVITNKGTGIGWIYATTPTPIGGVWVGTGRENTTTGDLLQAVTYTGLIRIVDYAGNYVIGDGQTYYLSGMYRAATS